MGMIRARCPRCRKLRRKAEATNTAPGKRWARVDGDTICWVCAGSRDAAVVAGPEDAADHPRSTRIPTERLATMTDATSELRQCHQPAQRAPGGPVIDRHPQVVMEAIQLTTQGKLITVMAHASSFDFMASWDEISDQLRREVLSMRGRWLVVGEGRNAVRYRSLSRARSQVKLCRDVGIRAHVVRYRRGMVRYVDGALEIADSRWLP